MPRGNFALQWPFRWLQETRTVPPAYEVHPSVQPVVEISREWPREIRHLEAPTTIAASGTTAFTLPAPPVGQQRLWIYFALEILDASTITQIRLFRESLALVQQSTASMFLGTPVDGAPIPLVGGKLMSDTAPTLEGVLPQPVVDGDNVRMRALVLNGLTATTGSYTGLFIDAPRNAPLFYP